MIVEYAAAVVDGTRPVGALFVEAAERVRLRAELDGRRLVGRPVAGMDVDGRVVVRVAVEDVPADLPPTVGDRLRSHQAHLLAANQAAREGRALVEAPECDVDGCGRVAGRSGLCTTHRVVRNTRARKESA